MFISSKTLNFAATTVAMVVLNNISASAAPVPHDFDDLPPASVYVVGGSDTSQGVPFFADCFNWLGAAAPFCGGMSMVVPPPVPPSVPRDCPEMGEQTMMFNNINQVFAYGESSINRVREPWYPFIYWGGNVNLSVDGDFHNFKDILDADGVAMGDGCKVSFEKLVQFGVNGAKNSCGYFVLNDCEVEKFMVGGQELFWDGAY